MRAASTSESRRAPPGRSSAASVVLLLVRRDERVDRVRRDRLRRLDQIADAVAVDREAELDLRLDLVAVGHGDVAHVVAEPGDMQRVRLVPTARSPRPGADPLADRRVADVPGDGLPRHAHPRQQVAELPVAVGRLVQVHVVHVDLPPRQVAVELGVQVQQRLLQRRQARDPHSGGRERVHPRDHADAVIRAVRGQDLPADPVGLGDDRLVDDAYRNRVDPVERRCELRGVLGDVLQDLVPVERLTPGEEPELQLVEPRPATYAHACSSASGWWVDGGMTGAARLPIRAPMRSRRRTRRRSATTATSRTRATTIDW